MNTTCLNCKKTYQKTPDSSSLICRDCEIRNELKIYKDLAQVLKTIGLSLFITFIPLFIFPLMVGPKNGYYPISHKNHSMFTPPALIILNGLNIAFIIAFLTLSRYFKRKFEKKKAQYPEFKNENFDFFNNQFKNRNQR